jgi:hypothetical protein
MKNRLLTLGVVVSLAVCFIGYLLVSVSHYNFTTGFYSYDPRTDEPSGIFLANRPDRVLVEALTKQVGRDGTYPPAIPPNKKVRVIKVEPIRVDIGAQTDWQAYAYVTTRLDYEDGTSRLEEFRFHSSESGGVWLPNIGDVTIRAYYRALADCGEESPGKSICEMQAAPTVTSSTAGGGQTTAPPTVGPTIAPFPSPAVTMHPYP